MKREKEKDNNTSYCIFMGSKSPKSTASENMKRTRELDINEKLKQTFYYLIL